MPAELLSSKLFVPALRPSLVPRPRLIQSLNEGLSTKRKLTLISAPAGSGKTTLVVNWLKQIDLPVAWLSLDQEDNDLPRFLAYLAGAFQQVDEELGASLRSALQSPQLPAVERVLTGLINEIAARTDPLILVLDDYHLLTDRAILEAMRFFLDHQPHQLHLVLTTREDPDLPLARLRGRDQLSEIRARDLRFTQEEAGIFLRSVMGLPLSDQDIAALEGRTEGWAVGLQLAGLSMQKQADLSSFIADFSGSHRHILDYLTDEVLQQQPEDIRNFLLQTALLDRLSSPLCDALTARNDSNKVLAHLEAANLFLIPLDEERRWYRFHHLFGELLRNQLARSQPQLIPELHRRASLWYEENGDALAAIEHALQDTDLTQAARLIEHHSIMKLYQGEVTPVVGWFDRLPETMLQTAPMLGIHKAWALVLMRRGTRRGEVEQALQASVQAADRLKAGKALRDLVSGHAASIRAFSMRSPALIGAKPEELIALSQEAQRLLPEHELAIRSVNSLNIGYAYLTLADLKAAELAYNQTLKDGLAGGNLYAAIYGPFNLVSCAVLSGRLHEALELCDTSLKQFNVLMAGQNFPPIGALYILKGSILLECNRLEEAEPVLMEGLDLMRWTGEYEAPNIGYAALARLHAIRGDRPAMLQALTTLEEIWPEGVFYTEPLRHRLSMRHWPTDSGVRKDAEGWLARSGIQFGKLQVIQGVDTMGAARFESYLGAAHVLACLAMGNPEAYPVDDAQAYLKRQAKFAETHGIVSWVVEIDIARTLLYQAAGKNHEALRTLETALMAAASTGLFRIFVDECEPLQTLLVHLKRRSTNETLTAYVNRLLEAFGGEPAKPRTGEQHETLLSERELQVLQNLAEGLSYQEIGHQLFLSLNTIQFHVKNIYRKLLVNKRALAIEKAREMNLI